MEAACPFCAVATPEGFSVCLTHAAAPATAQNQKDQLDARYNRALAAGYKALMLQVAKYTW